MMQISAIKKDIKAHLRQEELTGGFFLELHLGTTSRTEAQLVAQRLIRKWNRALRVKKRKAK